MYILENYQDNITIDPKTCYDILDCDSMLDALISRHYEKENLISRTN